MPSLQLRLSNTVDRAVAFEANDPVTLAAGARAAYAEYCHQTRALADLGAGTGLHDGLPARAPVTLELQVAAPDGGWDAPIRPPAGTPVRVLVSAELLERRPPDDWTDVWEWCAAARAHAERLRGFSEDVARDALGED
jgi:hypothetical protein